MTNQSSKDLKVELQSHGVRTDGIDLSGRQGGAGPAEGICLFINGTPASVPVTADYVHQSPFSLCKDPQQNKIMLYRSEQPVQEVQIQKRPGYYDLKTSEGIPYTSLALMHGTDCLGSTVLQKCAYWKSSGGSCHFCGIGISLANGNTVSEKDPVSLAEVAEAAEKLDGAKHVVLTSGSTPKRSKEVQHLARCTEAIKRRTGLAVQVQFLPLESPDELSLLKDHGVDSVGIHIESFDPEVLNKISPHKAAFGLKGYIEAWEEAVNVFGENQVASFILVGMGETDESILHGSEILARMGVYPYLVPFRPIPGTPLGNAKPPLAARMRNLYNEVAAILKSTQISAAQFKAGCVRCGSCSAMPDFEL